MLGHDRRCQRYDIEVAIGQRGRIGFKEIRKGTAQAKTKETEKGARYIVTGRLEISTDRDTYWTEVGQRFEIMGDHCKDIDPNRIVLNFHDSLIRQSDLLLLDTPNWLNDTIIGFYFEYLEHAVCKKFAEQVAFVCPQIVHLLKSADSSEVGLLMESMNLANKRYIFMAVNDSIALDSPGGTHWSLLLFRKATSTFHHHDSCSHLNEPSARHLANNLAPHLCDNTDVPLPGGKKFWNFVEVENSDQQNNSYDCGIHVILNVDKLACQIFSNEVHNFDEKHRKALECFKGNNNPAEARNSLRKLILKLGDAHR